MNYKAPAIISINNSITYSVLSMNNSNTVMKGKPHGCTWWDNYVSGHDGVSESIGMSDLSIDMTASPSTVADLSSSSYATVPSKISSSISGTKHV